VQAARGTALTLANGADANGGDAATSRHAGDRAAASVRENVQVAAGDQELPSSPAVDDAPGRRYPRGLLFAAVATVVVALDAVSKVLVVAHFDTHDGFTAHPPIRLLGGAIYVVETRNSGAAFSLGTGFTVLLTAVAVLVVGFILRTAGRMRSTGWAIALGLVLGGALGNLGDRLFRDPGVGRGHVVDWISLFSRDGHIWPIFNLADSAIVCGAVLSAILALAGIDIDGRPARARRHRAT
jgi:signal peptidase II